jgi:hypothetical protein
MYRTTQNFFPFQSIFQCGYVLNLHDVETHRPVPFSESVVKVHRTVRALTSAMFEEITKPLRTVAVFDTPTLSIGKHLKLSRPFGLSSNSS